MSGTKKTEHFSEIADDSAYMDEIFSKLRKKTEEINKEYEDCTEQLKKVENEYKIYENKMEDTEKKHKKIKDEVANLTTTEIKLQQEIAQLKHENSLPSKTLSTHDIAVYENIRERVELLKKITGARFEFPLLNDYISGYLNDKEKNLKSFNFSAGQNNISDLLWGEIRKLSETRKKKKESENEVSD